MFPKLVHCFYEIKVKVSRVFQEALQTDSKMYMGKHWTEYSQEITEEAAQGERTDPPNVKKF